MSLRVRFLRKCITEAKAGAIVTPSNHLLSNNAKNKYWRFTGRKNVNGAVHTAGGEELLKLTQEIPVINDVRCPENTAISTPSTGSLVANTDYVIHVVAPQTLCPPMDPSVLKPAYAATLAKAKDLGVTSVAVPAIGCGVQGWNKQVAFDAALGSVEELVKSGEDPLKRIDFILNDYAVFKVWRLRAKNRFEDVVEAEDDSMVEFAMN